MNKEWSEVKMFHEKFGHPISEQPIVINSERAKNRAKWMLEEITEFFMKHLYFTPFFIHCEKKLYVRNF